MEIMIVVILIAIMTAMILPEMKGSYEDTLLRSNSRELVNAFKLAYSRSVSFNQSHRVRIDSQNGRYAVEKQVIARGGETFVPLRDVPGGEGKLDTRITIQIQKGDTQTATEPGLTPAPVPDSAVLPDGSASVATTDIVFYPDGTSEGGDVLLQDRQGYRLVLRSTPTTARIRILELARP